MMETGSAERAKPTGQTEVPLARTGASNAPVLTQWSYLGQATGFQFLYPSVEESKLKQADGNSTTSDVRRDERW
jgi:hypothetical protein